MPNYYPLKASNPIPSQYERLIEDFYPQLQRAGVTIATVLATSGNGSPALVHHGYSAVAIVQVTSQMYRALGNADVIIRIDRERHYGFPERQQLAVLDHELHHIKVELDADGDVKRDCGGRPKLSLYRHDWQLGGFREIAERHGIASLDVVNFLYTASDNQKELGFEEVDISRIFEATESVMALAAN